MDEFLQALAHQPLIQVAVLAGLLASIACGMVGTYVVVRRITYLAGGIAHCVLGGMGAAVYLQKVHGIEAATPFAGALVAALAAAAVMGVVSLRFRQREDTVISALWALGMAAGVLFIAKTPGYQQDLMSYLFGNILMVSRADLWLMCGLDALVVVVAAVFHKQLLAVCFDEEFSLARGVNVQAYYLLLLGLTALTVVLLVTIVGIVMVIALLSLPVAVAGLLARRLWQMMLLAVVLSMLFTTAGLAVSYSRDLPAGAVIIVLAAGAYLLALVAKAVWGRLRATTSKPASPLT